MGQLRSLWRTLAATASLVFLGLTFLGDAGAQNRQGDYRLGAAKEVDVEITALFSETPPTGYSPFRIEVKNGSTTPFKGRFTASADSGWYRSETSYSSSFEFTVEPGDQGVHSFLVPVPTAELHGRHHSASLQWQLSHNFAGETPSGGLGSGLDPEQPAIAYGDAAANSVRSRISSSTRRSGRGTGVGTGASFLPEHLPTDPRALSGIDMLILTEVDWAKVAEASRVAMFDWIRLGGQLVIYPEGEGRTLAQLGIKDPEGTGSDGQISLGLGKIMLANPYEFGRPGSVDVVTPGQALDGRATRVEHYESYIRGWPAGTKLGKRRFATAQVVIILLLFGILVGPVNLFVWAKPGKRHRLFITTPLISLIASLLLAGLIAVQDGFGGKGSRHILVLADPDTNKAYIKQEQATRTGVLFSGTFEPNHDALAIPLAWAGSAPRSGGDENRSFRANGGSLSGDWFRSRSDQAQFLETVVPSRGGVEITASGGTPTATSSFGFPLRQLVYADLDGNYWRAETVETGAKVTLKSLSREDFAGWWSGSSSQSGQMKYFSSSIATQLPLASVIPMRGVYFATSAEAGDLAIETLGSIRWENNHTLIHGRAVQR